MTEKKPSSRDSQNPGFDIIETFNLKAIKLGNSLKVWVRSTES